MKNLAYIYEYHVKTGRSFQFLTFSTSELVSAHKCENVQ